MWKTQWNSQLLLALFHAWLSLPRGKWGECLSWDEGGPVRCLVGRGLGSTYVPLPVAFTGLCQDETKNPLHIPELSSALSTACALIPS